MTNPRKKWNIELLRCPKCEEKFKFRKISGDISLLKCSCAEYPLVEGIVYMYKDALRIKALKQFKKGAYTKGLMVLFGQRKLISIPAFFLLLHNFFKLSFYKILKFDAIVNILVPFSYPKTWGWYIKNRPKMPSYFFSLASTNILKRDTQKVVDIGCGVGQLLGLLTHKTNPQNVFGVDYSFINLLLARRFFASPQSLLICSDIEKGFPFKSDSFDLILSTDSFHYIKNKYLFLKESFRVVKNKGLLAVLHIVNSTKTVFGNVRGITPKKLSRLIRKAGFRQKVFYSNTSMWLSLVNNTQVSLGNSEFLKELKETFAYGFFVGKKKFSASVGLTEKEFKILKKSKINFSGDKELLNDVNLNNIIKYDSFLFLSPHLDDAILSCGLLMERLKTLKKKIKVISVFTRAGDKTFTPQAKNFLANSGYKDANILFAERKKEDKLAIRYFKADYQHLDFVDAAWRESGDGGVIYKNENEQFSGEISKLDTGITNKIIQKISLEIPRNKKTICLVPIGIGGHADHVIIRSLARNLKLPVLYWSDFPYNTNDKAVKRLLSERGEFERFLVIKVPKKTKKYKAIKFYRSQLSILFQRKRIPEISEVYYAMIDSKL